MIAAIWAQSPEGIIGFEGRIPWHFSGDLRRFKRLTLGSTIVMGLRTAESIGKVLPGRRNVVVSRRPLHEQNNWARDVGFVVAGPGVESGFSCASSDFPDVWVIGGAAIYAAAISLVDVVDVTTVPRTCVAKLKFDDRHVAVFAPKIDPSLFWESWRGVHEDEPTLMRARFVSRRFKDEPYDLADNRRLQELGSLRRTS